MPDDTPALNDADTADGGHGDIHLPPPSFVPICTAIGLAITFVGFIDQVRNSVGPLVWGMGLLLLVGSWAVWFRAARQEFNELPESIDGH